MTYKTHVVFAQSIIASPLLTETGRGIAHSFEPKDFVLVLITTYFFALAPDFDEPNSYLSKFFPWSLVSRVIRLFTPHRGVTHRLIAIPFLFIPLYFILNHFNPQYTYLTYFAAMAYFLHIIGDAMTVGGIKRFLYPLSTKTFFILPKSMRFKVKFTDKGIFPSFTEQVIFLTCSLLFIFEVFLYLTQLE